MEKAVVRGQIVALQAPQGAGEPSNNLTLHLRELEKQQQTKPRVRRRKKIIKIRADVNGIETKNTIQKVNKTRSWFFDGPLTTLIGKMRERTQR